MRVMVRKEEHDFRSDIFNINDLAKTDVLQKN